MRVLFAFMCILFLSPKEVQAKDTNTITINFSVKFREYTCSIKSSVGPDIIFGDVAINTLTLSSGPEIESELILSCRSDYSSPELNATNSLTLLNSATLRFTSPDLVAGSGGSFLDAGNNVAIIPYFNNVRMLFDTDYDLKNNNITAYKMKFQLVQKSGSVGITAGRVTVTLIAQLTYI